MSQNYGQTKVRTVSGCMGVSAFPFEGCYSQPCLCRGSLCQLCEHVGCKQDTARLCVPCARQYDALQVPAASGEPACYHPHSWECLLSGDPGILQGLRLCRSSSAVNSENRSPEYYPILTNLPPDGKGEDLAFHQPIEAFICYLSSIHGPM